MKKIILSAIAIFAFGVVSAQDVRFGVKAGLNIATLTGDVVDDIKSKIGFNVGGFSEIKISEKFAVQPELLYSTQGAKFDGGSESLNYINIPVMAKFFVAESFSIEAGPQIGFLTSAKAKFDDEDVSVDIKDELKSIDFGLNFGAGYDFTPNLSAGLRYNLGLSNIADNESNDEEGFETEDFELKNSVFSLSLSYKF
jgi:hypothetical protein